MDKKGQSYSLRANNIAIIILVLALFFLLILFIFLLFPLISNYNSSSKDYSNNNYNSNYYKPQNCYTTLVPYLVRETYTERIPVRPYALVYDNDYCYSRYCRMNYYSPTYREVPRVRTATQYKEVVSCY